MVMWNRAGLFGFTCYVIVTVIVFGLEIISRRHVQYSNSYLQKKALNLLIVFLALAFVFQDCIRCLYGTHAWGWYNPTCPLHN